MPISNFPEYARFISYVINTLLSTGLGRIENLSIDKRSQLRGFISGIVVFNDESELHFREFIDHRLREPRIMYAYHYQDHNKKLIFRYDNAAHHPHLQQIEHKHTPDGIHSAPPPTLEQIIDEIIG
ncbi:MAG: hypothetical protein KKD28_06780 [Chloroflexi bacterium]|nr:hypothetical protein [Chloroflexota bacterium]MBU1661161.1 hypothetical protein [Chloroflexota bacterium]